MGPHYSIQQLHHHWHPNVYTKFHADFHTFTNEHENCISDDDSNPHCV
jgi:hypothetical protein